MGTISYNVALLVSGQRHTKKRAGQSIEKSRAGRNDPCPCGSGKKYKKCCLDKNRASSGDGDRAGPPGLAPQILPRLWNDHAVAEDCAILGRIIDRDPAFTNVGFSRDKIDQFMETVVEEDPSFMEGDKEAVERKLDDLAIRYVRESGEGKIIEGMKDKFLAASARAQLKDEIRALATGICIALMGESAGDPEDNLLNMIFFRRALADILRSASLINRVADQLGGDAEELSRLMASDDPSACEKIASCINRLLPSDIDALQAIIEKDREQLWRTIASGEFPVPMPFATQLALLARLALSDGNDEKRSPEEMYEIIEAFSDELIEDDYVAYGRMLDRWLNDGERRTSPLARSVKFMAGLCAIRSMEDYVPSLLVRGGRRGLIVPIDEEEQRFIDCAKSCDDPESVAEYAAWLTSKGYAGMANRLLASRDNQSSEPGLYRPRKSSVG